MAEEQRTPTLTELSVSAHAALKMDPKGALKIAAQQHMINLKVSEVGMAVSSFPVFISRISDKADWTLSAVNSFEIGDNLFVEDDAWTGTHLPIGMQTYPFFLMRSPTDTKNFTIGIDEKSSAFSKDQGEALFEDGKASIRLSQATAQLELEVKHDVQTYKFTKKAEELGLIKAIDLQVQYHNGRINTLKGLNTIDELALYELDTEKFEELRKESYLLPLYSMLTSIYQFNNLIKLHNMKNSDNTIAQVKLEVPKEETAEA
ncbi:MAG: hypothetical protein ACJA2E_000087 [Arenicella sp.]|jgi:hypothetical protein